MGIERLMDPNPYDGFNHLEYPNDASGWGGSSPLFKELIDVYRPKLIIEVGTWKGMSAINMAESIKSYGLTNTKIICIDTWLGSMDFITPTCVSESRLNSVDLKRIHGYPSIYYYFLANVKYHNCEDIIIPLPNTSLIAARWLKRNKIKADMIYIDGSHDYHDVYWDCVNYFPLLNEDGIIFGDDYNKSGVKRAVDEYIQEQGVSLNSLVNYKRFWMFGKNLEYVLGRL